MSDEFARSTVELNAAQIRVLDWIKQGCPEGTFRDDDYSHRVSARALHSRGLIRVSGHGRSWRADLTERGKAWPAATRDDEVVRKRWERVTAANEAARTKDSAARKTRQAARKPAGPVPPKPPTEAARRRGTVNDLMRRLIDSDGKLTIPATGWKPEEAQWMERAALSSPDRPHGQTLRVHRTGYGENATAELSFTPYFRDLVDTTPVLVPDKVSKYHRAVREFLDDKDVQYVTKEHLARAARILHTIATEAERRGIKVLARSEAIKKHRSDRRQWHSGMNFCFETEHGDYGFEIREVGGKSEERISWDQRESRIRRGTPAWTLNNSVVFKGTGKLNLRQGSPPSSYGSPAFGDRKIVRLEDRITEAFIRFEMWQLEWADRKEQWRLREEQRQRAWEVAMAEAKIAYAADTRWEYFTSLVKETERLERYEQFLEKAKARAESLPPEQHAVATEFLNEIEERVRERNPLLSPERLIPKIKVPKPDDLRPYLRGWDPYGPGR